MRGRRLMRTVRMFVDTEDCGDVCVVSQVVASVVQFTDGTYECVLTDASDPARRITRRDINADDLAAFLEFAAALNSLPTSS